MFILNGGLDIILGNRFNKNQEIFSRAKNFFTSMRFLLLGLMILLAIMPVVSFDMIFLNNYKNDVLAQKGDEVKIESEKLSLKLSEYIRDGNYTLKYDISNKNGDILKTISSIFDNILIINSDFVVIDDISNYSKGELIVSSQVSNSFTGKIDLRIDEDKKVITCTTPLVGEDNKKVEGVIYSICSIDSTIRNIDAIRSGARALELVILLAAIVIAYVLAILITRPYKKMVKDISNLFDGQVKDMNITTFYETRQISKLFNKLINKQIRDDELKQEFVSNVSHELKTPITSIKVLADSLLQQENVPNELYREFLQDICSEIERESKIITDLLSLSRLEKSNDKLDTEKTSINEIILMVSKRLEPLAVQKNVRILFDDFQDVEAYVDKIKLSLVFTNLIENAIKYNVDGGWLRISLKSDFKYFYFKVVDGGIGIPLEEQEDIFGRFYRVDKSRTSSTGGTGLGLSIVKNIVLKHNGFIRVESDGESGSTFVVRIPLEFGND